MTMTNTFVDDELEALQFPFYWDSSEEEDIPVKNYYENGYGYQNEYQNGKVKENKKKNKNHHKNAINVIEQQEDHKTTSSSLGEDIQDNNDNEDSQENNEWPHYVNIAIHNHRNLSHSLPFTRGDSFESSQIFSVDKARYTARSKLMQVFEIFPWFHIPQSSPTHRFRESLAPHKGELIDNVTAAINYFWSEPFEEEDYSSLRAYYLEHGAPRRTFYSIIDLRSYMEKIRLDRQTKQLQSNLEAYSSRLSVVEDKLKELWLKVSSSSSSSSASFPLQVPLPIPVPVPVEFAFPIKEETPTLPTPTNWSPRSSNNAITINNDNDNNNNKKNKRKVDSLSDDLIKVAPKIQRVERVEKILEILTIATDYGAQKETEKEGKEQRQYLESNLCHEEEERRNGSRNGSEDGDESDGSGLEMPFEYLDEISLDENYNFFF